MANAWAMLSQQAGLFNPALEQVARTFTYPEIIARELLALYKAQYNVSLLAVQEFWQNNPLLEEKEREFKLRDFEQYMIVADIASMASFSHYPGLGVGVGPLTPTSPEQRSQQGFDWYQQVIQCVYMIRGLGQQELATVLMRHMQATLHFYERFPSLNSSGVTFKVQGTPTLQPSANAIPEGGGNALVKTLLVTINYKFFGASPL